jgi:hypothetical protein
MSESVSASIRSLSPKQRFYIPSKDSSVRRAGGKTYVVLENIRRPLAVYRMLNTGLLKRLKQSPKEEEE